MCDYSLMAIPNRLAVSGEELIVHRFEAGSVSLASALKLRRIQECRKAQCHGFWPTIKAFYSVTNSIDPCNMHPTRCPAADRLRDPPQMGSDENTPGPTRRRHGIRADGSTDCYSDAGSAPERRLIFRRCSPMLAWMAMTSL
jgi:hypothetical protein